MFAVTLMAMRTLAVKALVGTDEVPGVLSDPNAKVYQRGAAVFKESCASCHEHALAHGAAVYGSAGTR
ncbi:MAG: hypothetical protein NTZ79_04335 [Proteobacteria bacterium]|nr:hypothetical protein [Pseudomonadota bacterium]